jgi:hypothetical protein
VLLRFSSALPLISLAEAAFGLLQMHGMAARGKTPDEGDGCEGCDCAKECLHGSSPFRSDTNILYREKTDFFSYVKRKSRLLGKSQRADLPMVYNGLV